MAYLKPEPRRRRGITMCVCVCVCVSHEVMWGHRGPHWFTEPHHITEKDSRRGWSPGQLVANPPMASRSQPRAYLSAILALLRGHVVGAGVRLSPYLAELLHPVAPVDAAAAGSGLNPTNVFDEVEPTFVCPDMEPLPAPGEQGNLAGGAHHWACGLFSQEAVPELHVEQGGCLVYAFSADEHWETALLARAPGCEVHTFRSSTRAGVPFRTVRVRQASSGSGSGSASLHEYSLHPSPPALLQLMERLGHADRTITYLKLGLSDGMEWSLFLGPDWNGEAGLWADCPKADSADQPAIARRGAPRIEHLNVLLQAIDPITKASLWRVSHNVSAGYPEITYKAEVSPTRLASPHGGLVVRSAVG